MITTKGEKQTSVERKNEVNYDVKIRLLIAFVLGIAIASLFAYTGVDFILEKIYIFVAVIFVFALFVLLALFLINRNKEKIFETFLGFGETDLKEIDVKIGETIDNLSKNKVGEASSTGIYVGKKFFAWYSWKLYRQYVLQIIQVIFVILGGIIGTYLLYIQNEKIENQNELIINQNSKIEKQVYLEEASRRNNLVLLMDNILSQVNVEITAKNKQLSKPLIGRIQALSQGFQPYYFLEDSTDLTKEKYSPERGQFLLAIANSGIASTTMDIIYKRAIFSSAYLKDAMLSELYLQRVFLENANLQRAHLKNADLQGAFLSYASLQQAHLSYANLQQAILWNANLQGADIRGADLWLTDFTEADLQGANFSYAEL